MMDYCIIIPAIKKNAIIPDQLVKKLAGVTLIQRAIDVSTSLLAKEHIYIITDSQEISLIAERNGVNIVFDSKINVDTKHILESLNFVFDQLSKKYSFFVLNRANAPLVDYSIIKNAIIDFDTDTADILVSVKQEKRKLFKAANGNIESLFVDNDEYVYEEVNAFQIAKFDTLANSTTKSRAFVLPASKAIEIHDYQSWWICEKLLARKRIVFNVIGSSKVGMGHIYRSLSLAHEITSHEILFVCNEDEKIVVDKIASTDYKVLSFSKKELDNAIINLQPDLIINDVLNTEKTSIIKYKNAGIKVVNFEDLGTGSKYSDITINELYDEQIIEGNNFLWGSDYFFLRDEFNDARPHDRLEKIKAVLITFGGTDQNNLTLETVTQIYDICEEYSIKIYIVCGSGYLFKEELELFINSLKYKNIELTFASGVISQIMEKTQVAISSNGRTTYELADMNIPSIIVSTHEREATHSFASLEKGFVNIGVYNSVNTKSRINISFKKLIEDSDYRELLFLNIQKYSFRKNKTRVVKRILELIK